MTGIRPRQARTAVSSQWVGPRWPTQDDVACEANNAAREPHARGLHVLVLQHARQFAVPTLQMPTNFPDFRRRRVAMYRCGGNFRSGATSVHLIHDVDGSVGGGTMVLSAIDCIGNEPAAGPGSNPISIT
jgi:hypothetical protein